MAEWNEGTITDIAARPGFHRETTPIWLVTACTLLSSRGHDLSKPFRYADLGCGSGLNAMIVAATCPRAEVWGFDFNPANIEAARDLAEQAGLRNIHFEEVSFAELAGAKPGELPQFEFMVAEAVLSVVSAENRSHIQTVIRRHLRPGGLVYLGYHADAGWTEFAPLQTLMRILFERGIETSDFAVGQILDYLDRLTAGGALYLTRNPSLAQHLANLRDRPAGDVACELLNQDWQALMFADVADAMAEVKCEFLGSATLHENIAAASVPEGMLPLLDEAPSIRVRETMHDVAARTAYRRDIYRRGLMFPPVAEHRARLDAIVVAASNDGELTLSGLPGSGLSDPTQYRPVLDALRNGPLSVAKARTMGFLAGETIETAADALAMLIGSGHAHPMMPGLIANEAAAPVARLNDAIIDAITRGHELHYLVSPTLGTAIETNPLEALTVGALLCGGNPADLDGLSASVMAAMNAGGRSVMRDGVTVHDEGESRAILRDVVAHVLEHRVPLLRAVGVLPG